MDGTRFDSMARKLSITSSRRASVKAVAVAGLGLGLARLGFESTDAKKKKRCKKLGQGCNSGKKKCCGSLLCETGLVALRREGASKRTCCKSLGSTCNGSSDCCEGACVPPLIGDGPKECTPLLT